MDVEKRVLYITYDGLTDPLGQSQILPYLKGLSLNGYQFTILSFEKKLRFNAGKDLISRLCAESGISWVPLSFTEKPPILSKFYDATRMRSKAVALHKHKGFDMVHCRSYIAADVGLHLKKKYGVKFFFDMRGFWADEKKDGGSWNMDHPVYKRVYHYYKERERQYLQNADCIISLTEAGKKEMLTWDAYNIKVPLEVIPCCADMDHFSLTDEDQKIKSKAALGFSKSNLVISYLGSVGTWYMLDEMLILFKQLKRVYNDAKFLIVTHTEPKIIENKITELALNRDDILITQATRMQVPLLIKASDINISFIKPVYSKISSSPTKLGEVLSMGIPVIVNSGVGDVKEIVEKTGSGYVINNFTNPEFDKAIAAIPFLVQKDPGAIRAAAKNIYDLHKGIELYLQAYRKVI